MLAIRFRPELSALCRVVAHRSVGQGNRAPRRGGRSIDDLPVVREPLFPKSGLGGYDFEVLAI